MTNALYPKFKELALGAGGNLAAGTVRAQLIDTAAYTYSALNQHLDEVPAGARIGAPMTLVGKSLTDGVFDAADPPLPTVATHPTVEAIVIYVDTGVEATSPLAVFIDTAASGLPIAANGLANGGTLAWDNGASRIAAL